MNRRGPLLFASLLPVTLAVWALGAGAPNPWSASAAEAHGAAGEPVGEVRTDANVADPPPPPAVLTAVHTAPTVRPPHVERARFGPVDPSGLGYRVALQTGDTLRVTVEGGAARLHAFPAGEAEHAELAALAASHGDGTLELVAAGPGDVVVLVHGEPDGDVLTVRVDRSGTLLFPVTGKGLKDVISPFLDSRDGGRRAHHGVDIAAPRGNPVRAVADGTIERVETTPLGGLTVRLLEARTGHIHYYAHLSSAFVEAGERVAAGQTLGGVGNTGNARNSPPHLHYAVFDGSAILDPVALLASVPLQFDDAQPSPLLGTAGRTRVAGAALRAAPTSIGPARSLDHHHPVQVLAETGRYLRVRDASGQEGYLAAWVVDPAVP